MLRSLLVDGVYGFVAAVFMLITISLSSPASYIYCFGSKDMVNRWSGVENDGMHKSCRSIVSFSSSSMLRITACSSMSLLSSAM
jgi:hypothetical protein